MKKIMYLFMAIGIIGLLLLSGCVSDCKTDADCKLNEDCKTISDISKRCTAFSCGTSTISGEVEYMVKCIHRTGESHRCLTDSAIESNAWGECVKV